MAGGANRAAPVAPIYAPSLVQFASTPREKGAHWVSPTLVGEVVFSEWTGDGKLRHPRFLGLRPDKKAEQVRCERPRSAPV